MVDLVGQCLPGKRRDWFRVAVGDLVHRVLQHILFMHTGRYHQILYQLCDEVSTAYSFIMYTVLYIIVFLWPDAHPLKVQYSGGDDELWQWAPTCMSNRKKKLYGEPHPRKVQSLWGKRSHTWRLEKWEVCGLNKLWVCYINLGEVKEIGEEAMNGSGLKLHIPFQMRELSQAEGFHWWSLVRPSHRCCKGLDTCFLKEVSGNQTTSHN